MTTFRLTRKRAECRSTRLRPKNKMRLENAELAESRRLFAGRKRWRSPPKARGSPTSTTLAAVWSWRRRWAAQPGEARWSFQSLLGRRFRTSCQAHLRFESPQPGNLPCSLLLEQVQSTSVHRDSERQREHAEPAGLSCLVYR